MEIIGMGILLAIGFYMAPMIIGIVVMTIAAILVGIASIFG